MSDTTTPVIRYTKETMIALHDSPLVQKPEHMPSLLAWFGEDSDSPASKSILNGYVITRTLNDKSIVLGPTKTNFASSLYGGLKQNDPTAKVQQLPNTRYRQLDERSNTTSIREYRSPRGSFIGDKGFSKTDKTDNRKFMSSPPHNNKRNFNTDRINDKGSGRHNPAYNNRNNRHTNGHHQQHQQNHSHHHHNHYQQESEGSERVPEWMDYTPEDQIEVKEKEQEEEGVQFSNDLETWKSNMKKRDGVEEPVVETSLASLSLEVQDPLSFFEDIVNNEPRREQKGGSRFARFFAKREEPSEPTQALSSPAPAPPAVQSRSISLNDLFQQPAMLNEPEQQQQQQQQQQENVRIYSEEDILKSLGAKKDITEDGSAMGFNRVLQILSQPKPTLTEDISHEQEQPQPQQQPQQSPKLNKGSPMVTGSPLLTDTKPMRFGNNLPTSVLRQMSARSNQDKSPKSTPPIRYSPKPILHPPPPPPPTMPPLPMPPQQFFALQQNGPYSPGHPMMDHRGFEQLMQYDPRLMRNGNGSNSNGEFLPPHMMMVPPPPLPPGQRPMMTPPQFNQQMSLHMQRFPVQQQQQQQQQQQRDMVPPMLPHLMANGIPPQMLNKNQGWEQR